MLQLLWNFIRSFSIMNLKLCTIAAICGLPILNRPPRSIKPRSSGSLGQSVAKQIDNLNSYSILANYNKAVVRSNLK